MQADAAAPDFLLSADAGGTFLDLVLVDSLGRIAAGKSLHTPARPEVGIMRAVADAAASLGHEAQDVLRRCKLVFHGTTVTTNALIERKGRPTGLICTKGFEDTLYIGRVKARTEGLDELQMTRYAHLDRPEPIIPFSLIRGISERMDHTGRVLAELNLGEVDAAVAALAAAGVEAIAVSLLHAYANAAHEQAVRRRIEETHPDISVVLSSDIAPVIGEYERTNTTAVNAYLNPLLERHLSNLDRSLAAEGYRREVLVMQSIGGVSPTEEIRKRSVQTLLSGPVGGLIGAQKIGALIGESNIITTDMGGTSFDVGVINGGMPLFTTHTTMHRQIVNVSAVDIVTIGAGGGSLVWLDENKNIQVGPQSVGARPGPACYGQGGTMPTVTDADVVLGFIDASSFSLGEVKASRELSMAAFEAHIGSQIGMDALEAADAVLQIVNNRMADLVRKATIERGHDPRDFVLMAYGGSGPAHCTAYGAEIGARKIIVPAFASIFSAFGIAQADVKQTFSRSRLLRLSQDEAPSDAKLAAMNDIFATLRQNADTYARSGKHDTAANQVLSFAIDVHFKGQTTEITVPVLESLPLGAADVRAIVERFQRMYEQNYGSGSSSPTSSLEFITFRAELTSQLSARFDPRPLQPAAGSSDQALRRDRRVYWGRHAGWRSTRVYDGERLGTGHRVQGPALVELFRTTVPVYAGQIASIDEYRNVVIENGAG